MLVLAFATPRRLALLARALSTRDTLIRPEDARGGDHLLRDSPVVLLVLEPLPRASAASDAEQDPAVRLLVERSRLTGAVVLYTRRTAATALAQLQRLIRTHRVRIVFCEDADELTQLRRAVEELARSGITDAVVDRLGPMLRDMPESIRRVIHAAFRDPAEFRQVLELAHAADVSRRTLDRWIGRCGLVSAEHLLSGAAVVRAYELLHDRGYRSADVIPLLGVSNRQALRVLTLRVVHQPPSQLRLVSCEELITRVVEWIVRPDALARAAAPRVAAWIGATAPHQPPHDRPARRELTAES
jgi:hypothetical protein